MGTDWNHASIVLVFLIVNAENYFKQVCWIADHNLVIAASKNEDAPPVDVPDWHGHAAHAKTCLVLFGCVFFFRLWILHSEL